MVAVGLGFWGLLVIMTDFLDVCGAELVSGLLFGCFGVFGASAVGLVFLNE